MTTSSFWQSALNSLYHLKWGSWTGWGGWGSGGKYKEKIGRQWGSSTGFASANQRIEWEKLTWVLKPVGRWGSNGIVESALRFFFLFLSLLFFLSPLYSFLFIISSFFCRHWIFVLFSCQAYRSSSLYAFQSFHATTNFFSYGYYLWAPRKHFCLNFHDYDFITQFQKLCSLLTSQPNQSINQSISQVRHRKA